MFNAQVVVNNQLISYFSTETADEQSLLFLHGWKSSKEVWRESANLLISRSANQPINIYALDLPGFGQSPAPKEAWGVSDYAQIVKDFIEKLELKKVVLIGHSFGGRVGIKLASEHKSLLFKLVLVDSAGFAYNNTKKKFVNSLAKIVKPIFKPKLMQGFKRKAYRALGSEDYLDTGDLKPVYLKVIGEDLSEDMKRINIPTLIIVGENDQDTPVEFGQRMHFLIPNSEFQIIANAGHYSFLDQPTIFIHLLTEFTRKSLVAN